MLLEIEGGGSRIFLRFTRAYYAGNTATCVWQVPLVLTGGRVWVL